MASEGGEVWGNLCIDTLIEFVRKCESLHFGGPKVWLVVSLYVSLLECV